MQGIYCNLLVVLICSGLKERYTLQVSSLWLMWKMGGGGWVQYLDENKQLILAILDNQNLGKLNECATWVNCGASFCKYTICIFIWFLGFRFHMGNVSDIHETHLFMLVWVGWACRYQAKLQQNLMYLAAIADAQPQSVQNSSQVPYLFCISKLSYCKTNLLSFTVGKNGSEIDSLLQNVCLTRGCLTCWIFRKLMMWTQFLPPHF